MSYLHFRRGPGVQKFAHSTQAVYHLGTGGAGAINTRTAHKRKLAAVGLRKHSAKRRARLVGPVMVERVYPRVWSAWSASF